MLGTRTNRTGVAPALVARAAPPPPYRELCWAVPIARPSMYGVLHTSEAIFERTPGRLRLT